MTEPLVPDAELVARVHHIESACSASRLGVLERLPGNHVGVEFRELGDGALAMQARRIPSTLFNRATCLNSSHADQVEDIVAWYRERGVACGFDVVPGFTPPEIITNLAALGFGHLRFHATVVARPRAAGPNAEGVTVEQVTADTLEDFLDCYCRGWAEPDPEGFKNNVRGWLTEPGWRLFLGRHEGRPAGTAVLYQLGKTGYCADSACDPEFRGRGVHAALLARRLEVAGEAGCDLVCSMAEYLSTSHRNMIRAGFTLLHTKSIWTEQS